MSKHSRPAQTGTPGRRQHVTRDQYFDVGRVGRKTGITLKDTGIRDDYGMEPMSGIFSSPASVQQSEYTDDGSAEMEGLDSVVPDIDETLRSRRSARYLTARSTPPRRSDITSTPRRQSSSRQQPRLQDSPAQSRAASRRLDFAANGMDIRNSIEKASPFKPKHVLRRSVAGDGNRRAHDPPSDRSTLVAPLPPARHHDKSPEVALRRISQRSQYNEERLPESQTVYDEEVVYDEGTSINYSTREEIEGALDAAGNFLHHSSPRTPRKRQRESDVVSAERASGRQQIPHAAPMLNSKRARRSTTARTSDHEQSSERTATNFASEIQPPSKRQLQKMPAYDDVPLYDDAPAFEEHVFDDAQHYEGTPVADEEDLREDALVQSEYDLPDGYDDDEDYGGPDDDLPELEPYRNGHAEELGTQPPIQDSTRHNATKRKSPPRVRAKPTSQRQQRSQSVQSVSSDDSDSETSRSQRAGSRSNVRLRSTTPFEDAQRTTRSGRPVIKPLDWWAGEAVIWKNGEVDGVIRANSVEPERRMNNKKRTAHKKKTNKIKSGLNAIDEQDEDMLPSEWEDEIGVLTGDVARFDPESGVGNDEDLIEEDLAFAASSIITRPVEGSAFRYAKIQTLPFFGSGVVELPPGGMKSTKNSRKMQMNFFVHKGKVQVTISTPTSVSKPDPVTYATFNITEGGAWVVPRGNNYTITNVSSSRTAFLFFSQGCEIEAEYEQDEGE